MRATRNRRQPEDYANPSSLSFLEWGGEMGERIAAFDWERTPLGPIQTWSPTLKVMVRFLLANRFPMLLWWGPEFVQIYNDAYRPVLGAKHPSPGLGHRVRECWSEIWDILRPLIETPFKGGPATWMDDILLEIKRHGFTEETHFTIAYSPVPDEDVPDGIGGVLATVNEITEKVVAERRVVVLRDLGSHLGEAKTAEEACSIAAQAICVHDKDVPFLLLYLTDPGGKCARLSGAAGVPVGTDFSPISVEFGAGQDDVWSFAETLQTGTLRFVQDLAKRFRSIPRGPWSDPPDTAVVVPIPSNKPAEPAGLMIAGVSARLKFDAFYRDFFELVRTQIATAITNARAYEEERQRAEALAEVDRVKTEFFSNVSHEFRTPLTLMLGPMEDLLAGHRGHLPPAASDTLELAHRNSLRLLKLVNTLLDFARIEAGRIDASYEPTDLATHTVEVASTFRAAVEKAGLQLVLDCPCLPEPVYVDREMWEKIVLNLLSNAFKFTFLGRIEVALRWCGERVELCVTDTGIGIPAADLPKLFERFHRARTRSRTPRSHEGTGIGLPLVQELARLHGGSVNVESKEGHGARFTVSIRTGQSHLPPERIQAVRELASSSIGPTPFLQEAGRWLRDEPSAPAAADAKREYSPPPKVGPSMPLPRILLADDNADMREYVRRLLAEHFQVETADDGQAALESVRADPPDLVLSDVMMPRLDGFGLLHALRADEALRDIPVIFLSARAGEEARVGGFEVGADDYLTKPFTARELLARVSAHIKVARLRKESQRRLHESRELIQADLQIITVLYEVANECARDGQDLNRCLNRILEAAIATTGADKGNIQLRDLDSGSLMIAAHHGFREPFLKFFASVQDDSHAVCAAAMKSGGRIVVEDVTRSESLLGTPALDVLLEAGVRAVQSTPLISSAGNLLGMISTHYSRPYRPTERQSRMMDLLARQAADYLDRKRAEDALRYRGEQFETLLNRAPLGVYVVDAEFRICDVNPTARAAFGIPNLIGRSYDEVVRILWTKEYADEIAGLFRHTLKTGESYETAERAEYRADRDMTEYYEWRIDRITLPDGRLGVVCYFRDISAQVQSRAAIAESEERFRTLADNMSQLAWMADDKGSRFWFNRRWFDYTGLTSEQAHGPDVRRIYHPDHLERVLAKFRDHVARGETWEDTFPLHGKDGRYRWFLARAIPIRDVTGKVVRWFGTNTDITELRETQAQLAQANEELSSRAKHLDSLIQQRTAKLQETIGELEAFCYSVSHDLRAPLRAMSGYASVLLQQAGPQLSPQNQNYVQRIGRAASHLDRLTREILAYSQLARADIVLHHVDLDRLTRQVLELYPALHCEGVDIKIRSPLLPVLAHESLLTQVLSNLLNNACKFVSPGTAPRVVIRTEPVAEHVRIWVEDNGIGISREHRHRLFKIFGQIHPDHKYEGTGMGLAIVKKAAERMGGTVDFESEPGKGSRFWVQLPRGKLSEGQSA